MFSDMSNQGKLALRLPAQERHMFLKKYNAKLGEAYGVPASLLSCTRELKKFFDAVELRCLRQAETHRKKKSPDFRQLSCGSAMSRTHADV